MSPNRKYESANMYQLVIVSQRYSTFVIAASAVRLSRSCALFSGSNR